MFRILPRSQGNVIGFAISGKITRADYIDILIPQFNTVLAKHGQVRALLDFDDDFSGYEWKAIIEDIRYGIRHVNRVEKIAAINAPPWIGVALKIFNKLSKCQCRTFDKCARDEAWNFIEG